MASEESIPTLKMLIIGPSGSGKSALLIRYCDDQFDSESSTATIGVDFKIKKLSVHGSPYRLNLLDTAGQERFRTLSNSYYRGAHGIILCYDISDRSSFLSLETWYDEIELNAIDNVVTYLVGCKLDVVEKDGSGVRGRNAVSFEEGRKLAEEKGSVGFVEVSSKLGTDVKRPFVEVVDRVVRDGKVGLGRRETGRVGLGRGTAAVVDGGCGC